MTSNHNVISIPNATESFHDVLTEVPREGVKNLVQQAIATELQELLDGYHDQRTPNCRRAVVR